MPRVASGKVRSLGTDSERRRGTALPGGRTSFSGFTGLSCRLRYHHAVAMDEPRRSEDLGCTAVLDMAAQRLVGPAIHRRVGFLTNGANGLWPVGERVQALRLGVRPGLRLPGDDLRVAVPGDPVAAVEPDGGAERSGRRRPVAGGRGGASLDVV